MTLVAMLAACGSAPTGGGADRPEAAADCSVPYKSMDQVFGCGSAAYEVAKREGSGVIHIVVESKDPETIAAAMAGAWNSEIAADEGAVVWVYSDASVVGMGYDRGVLSEQGQLNEILVFQVCTSWEEFEGLGELCNDETEFRVEQE